MIDRPRRADGVRYSADASRPLALRFIVAALFVVGLSVAHGQPPGKPLRVGVLLSGSEAQWAHFDNEVVAGLRDKGFVEGRNLVLVRRYGGLKLDRITDSAAELARYGA